MLHRKRSTREITKMDVQIGEASIPLVIYRELRHNWRIAIAQQSVNLRIPLIDSPDQPGDPVQWAMKWIKKKFASEPQIFNRFFLKAPTDGKIYQTVFGAYTLRIVQANRKTAGGQVVDRELIVKCPNLWNEGMRADGLPRVVSKLLAHALHDDFFHKIMDLNDRYYQFVVEGLSFKYNKSNWGSCSHDGNLTFSTRLFLAPEPVVDYVIIHELAHLRHHNHSRAFWDLVAAAMPDYRRCTAWLKEHGNDLYF